MERKRDAGMPGGVEVSRVAANPEPQVRRPGVGWRMNRMRKVAVTPLVIVLAAVVLLSGCNTLRARIELNKGNKNYKDEKYKDALFHFQQGLKYDPSLKFAWRSVALTAMTLYRPGVEEKENIAFADTAIDAFKKYIQAFPEDQKAQEFLIGTYVNAGRFDDVLRYLEGQVRANPGDIKSHKAIISIKLRNHQIKEAYDWITSHIPKADFEPYYLVGVYCWDKAYRDPSITTDERTQWVDLGLTAEGKSLELNPQSFESMVYTNLLYREKAKLQVDLTERDKYYGIADEWRNKAMALREELKKQGKA
jgi:tetratricopeptide (TPR) repeat protein